MVPKPGRYQHYKGNTYELVGVAKHSESLEDLVVYRAEYGEHQLWVRPLEMFMENVVIDGKNMPRFRHLD